MPEGNNVNVLDFPKRKAARHPISMLTCYDFWSARVLNETEVDCLLVGDSLATVMHGFDSTAHATVELMALHARAVRRGAPDKFLIGDMPFLSVRKGRRAAMEAVQELARAGCDAVKIEGEAGQLELMAHIVESGIPVMGHLGLTPQSAAALGGCKLQGRDPAQAAQIRDSAKRLAAAGCFALVLECIPAALGDAVTQAIHIPTIGIGAGPHTDGQVLVLQDMLGMNAGFQPKFLRRYAEGGETIRDAVSRFHREAGARAFPAAKECYQ